jgi:hypothetical protein
MNCRHLLLTALLVLSAHSNAQTAKISTEETSGQLSQFGFGPALFLLNYKEPVFKDSRDVRLRSDGNISAAGSKTGTALGLEVHYGFSFFNKATSFQSADGKTSTFSHTSGHVVSPFLGLFDVDNGINGIAAGLLYGYWRGDKDYKKTASLNVGLGWTVHRNQIVLTRGLSDGAPPLAGLAPEDFTTRKDVRGITIMISASFGF